MKGTWRRWLSGLYVPHLLWQSVARSWDRARYHRLVRRHRIEYYEETGLARALKDVTAIDLLARVQRLHPWIPQSLLPAGGSADHKFLYVLGRALSELPFTAVLELGAGETTKMTDAFAERSGASVLTLEHDETWARRVRDGGLAPTHQLMHRPLTEYRNELAGRHAWYEVKGESELSDARYDLVVVDGPSGTKSFSRAGIIEFFLAHRADEWLLLWDDLHRVGDLESFATLLGELERAGVPCGHRLFVSTTTLGAIFTPRFEPVRYYL